MWIKRIQIVKITDLNERPQLSGFLELGTLFRCELFELLQTGRNMVDAVTDDLRVTRLIA